MIPNDKNIYVDTYNTYIRIISKFHILQGQKYHAKIGYGQKNSRFRP